MAGSSVAGLDAAGRSRLASVARRRVDGAAASAVPAAVTERCDLCATAIGPDHPHLLDLDAHDVRCACRACAVLFDRHAAAAGNLRRIPDRRWRLPALTDGEIAWDSFGIPVDVAFLVVGELGAATAHYPGPAGITRADVPASDWSELVSANPTLRTLEPHVEALLGRSVRGAREQYIVPIDECFRLVGVLRAGWQGLSGGTAVFQQVDEFFDRLAACARTPPRLQVTEEVG